MARCHPDLVTLEEIGHSRQGRPLQLLTLAHPDGPPVADRPTFWLDGGTHAAEWTGVMSAIYSLSRWLQDLTQDDKDHNDWFKRHAVCVLPCMSPDGYDALMKGAAFLRSTLRPPPHADQLRVGLDPTDLEGDGKIGWMRWRHPAGPHVQDQDLPLFMRSRRLDDDPFDAFFVCTEGNFLEWDGARWVEAPLQHGLDLNRNVPGHWQPFSMFGMDGGEVPLSEPESRAVADAVRARSHIAAALTNHTYTGALLTQPYRDPSPLSGADLDLMEVMAKDAVGGTGYRAMRVQPDFVYDPKQAIVGVWADTLSTVFGIPAYTLELWDPFAAAGVSNDKPAAFFKLPDEDLLRALFARFGASTDEDLPAWRPFEHPQLGPVELDGIDYLRTVRNPPVPLLAAECGKGHVVADRLRRSLPELRVRLEQRILTDPGQSTLTELTAVVENVGFLPTSGLPSSQDRGLVPALHLRLDVNDGLTLVSGQAAQELGQLDGWGSMRIAGSRHSLYPALPSRGHRASARWVLRGSGTVQVSLAGGRSGRGLPGGGTRTDAQRAGVMGVHAKPPQPPVAGVLASAAAVPRASASVAAS